MNCYERLISFIVAGCLLGSCGSPNTAEAFQPSNKIVIVAPSRSVGGVSSVVVHFAGGHLSDPVEECGVSHLSEHLLARAMYDALSSKNPEFGFEVNAATGIDQVLLTITVGGAEEGLASVLQEMNTIINGQNWKRFEAEELKLLDLELKLPPALSETSEALINAMTPNDRRRISGSCAPPKKGLDRKQIPIITALTIGSELSKESVQKLISEFPIDFAANNVTQQTSLTSMLSKASAEDSVSYFFVPLRPEFNGKQQALLEASLGFWTEVDALDALGNGEIRLTPFGRQGYIVRFSTAVSLADIRSAGRSMIERQQSGAGSIQESGAQKICGLLGNIRGTYRQVAGNIANNAWLRVATSQQRCKTVTDANASREWLAGLAEYGPVTPIPLRSGMAPSKPAARPDISLNRKPISLCDLSADEDTRHRSYYEQVGLRYLLGQYRFKYGTALNGYLSHKPKKACIEYDLLVSSDFSVIPAEAIGNKSISSLISDWNAAHRAHCLNLSLQKRQSLEDVACGKPASPTSVAYAKKYFGAGMEQQQ